MGLVAFAAQYRTPGFWLERHLVVFAAIVANYFVLLWCVFAISGLFRATARTPLRLRHVALIELTLFFFGEKEYLFALNTRDFDIRHKQISSKWQILALGL